MSVETHAHHEHPDVVGSRNRLGVILLLVADIAFALSMVFVYFYLRGQNVNDMWLPAATADRPAIEPLSAGPGWTVTAIVALGLLAHMYGLRCAITKSDTVEVRFIGGSGCISSCNGLSVQHNCNSPIYILRWCICFMLLYVCNHEPGAYSSNRIHFTWKLESCAPWSLC
jgi:protein-S-isoprenylcysteine O-methyltransferase Ste14